MKERSKTVFSLNHMPKAGKTIAVLGGGIGGVVAVHELSKRLMRQHKIVLIEKRKTHLYQPALLWAALGLKKVADAEAAYGSFAKKRIEVVDAEILSLDPENKSIKTDKGIIDFDSALIALGAEFNSSEIIGLEKFGLSFYEPAGAPKVFEAIDNFKGKSIALVVSRLPFKCPAAPYEMAFLLDEFLKRKKIRDNVLVSFFTPELQPLPSAGIQVGKFVAKFLDKKNIRYHPNHILREVKKGELIFGSGTYTYDLLIYVPPHQAPKVIRDCKLAGERGWIPVDPKTLRTNFPGIYAIGDCTEIPITGGKFLPKAGVIAHGQAEIAAHNIILEMLNARDRESYHGFGSCFVETGWGNAAYFSGHFYHQPTPSVRLWNSNPISYWIKHLFAKYWKWKWF